MPSDDISIHSSLKMSQDYILILFIHQKLYVFVVTDEPVYPRYHYVQFHQQRVTSLPV